MSINNLIAIDLNGGLYVDLADDQQSFQPEGSPLFTCQSTSRNLDSTKILEAEIHIRSLLGAMEEALASWTL